MKIFALLIFVFVLCGAFVWLMAQTRAEKPLPPLENPRIAVKKKDRELKVYDGERLVKTYKMVLGFEPTGDKQKQGDGRTPEGEFYVGVKNPKSNFYLSLGLSYPTEKHAERGLREKLISQNEYDQIKKALKEQKMPPQNTALGGDIYIHAGGTLWDWTWGCVALEETDIKELFDRIPVGARVVIEP